MSEVVTTLPRGGAYVRTSAGPVQFGIPPETIKDSMALGLEVPSVYVIPREPFDRRRGVNLAEFEFPAYYSFFILKRRVRLVINDAAAEARVRAIFQESLFGPAAGAVAWEFTDEVPPGARPDFARESDAFRRGPGGKRLEVDTLVELVRFGDDGVARLGDVEIVRKDDGYVVRDRGREIASAPLLVELPPRRAQSTSIAPFQPPAFGVTVLGASHGFDPAGKTTGFVLWLGHRGLLVDPPGDATELLRERGVAPKLIDGVILTHCHADHDSGTFQKLLEEGRIVLTTTPTILGSFLRKYGAISGISEHLLRRTFTFNPVKIGAPVRTHGGEIWFFYTLHSIPTIGFEVFYGGKSLAFSADSLYDPERIRAFEAAGVLGHERADDLVSFPWYHTVILHEAGIPPLHTPASVLAKLPDDVKRRLYLVHIAEKDVPQGQGLKPAKVGIENTIRIAVDPPRHADAIELLDLFQSVDIFKDLPFSRAREILQVAHRVRYPKSQRIIADETPGETFYIIVSGVAAVVKDGRELKTYQSGDYFGETALILGQPRNADVIAKTDVDLVEIGRYDFLYLLRGTDIPGRLVRLAKMREERSWEAIERNSALRALSSAQKTELQSMLEPRELREGETIWARGELASSALIVDDAAVVLDGPGGALEPFRAGAFLGDVDAIQREQPLETTARAIAPGRVFRISRADLLRFFQENPGVLVSFLGTRFVE